MIYNWNVFSNHKEGVWVYHVNKFDRQSSGHVGCWRSAVKHHFLTVTLFSSPHASMNTYSVEGPLTQLLWLLWGELYPRSCRCLWPGHRDPNPGGFLVGESFELISNSVPRRIWTHSWKMIWARMPEEETQMVQNTTAPSKNPGSGIGMSPKGHWVGDQHLPKRPLWRWLMCL